MIEYEEISLINSNFGMVFIYIGGFEIERL